MTIFRAAFMLLCLALAACGDIKQRAVPGLDSDPSVVKRIMAELSPWEDGSPDRSRDGLTPGDANSDRQLFGRWMYRYAAHEAYTQHDRDYQPFDVPGTIGEAIEQQRRYEEEGAARQNQQQQQQRQQEMADTAARQADARQMQAAQAAQDAYFAGQDARYEAQREAVAEQYRLEQAERDRQHRQSVAESERAARIHRCRTEQSEAVSRAIVEVTEDDPGLVERVRASFKCDEMQ